MNTYTDHFAGQTHAGLKRKHNEDCFDADGKLGLFIVADGVGGHSCGEVASEIVRTVIKQEVAQGHSLTEAVMASHEAVLARISRDETTQGMGSTAVVLQIHNNQYTLCWVGDSRAYLWDKQLRQLTADHNRASELLANNLITAAQAAVHPERHVLTQSLGVSESIVLAPGEASGELQPGQQILLCSDGLTDELDDASIARVMAQHARVEDQVDALISAALEAGGNDNITAVIVGEAMDPGREASDLDTTRETGRTPASGDSSAGGFPFKALLIVTALTAAALWLMF